MQATGFGFSKEFSFLSAPVVGPQSTIHVLHSADLGHVTLDGADEYDYVRTSWSPALCLMWDVTSIRARYKWLQQWSFPDQTSLPSCELQVLWPLPLWVTVGLDCVLCNLCDAWQLVALS